MAKTNTSNRGRGRNNNPQGHNQYSSSWVDTARERPLTAAATAAAAVGAGVFLWSKRNQISDQITNLSDQITDWADSMRSTEQDEFGTETESLPKNTSRRSSGRKTQQEIAEEALTLKETGAAI